MLNYFIKKNDYITKWMVSEKKETPFTTEKKAFEENIKVGTSYKEIVYPIRKDFLKSNKFLNLNYSEILTPNFYSAFEGDKIDFSHFWHKCHIIDFYARANFVMKEKKTLEFDISTCGGIKIFVNKKESFSFYPYTRNDEVKKIATLELEKGNNEILVACNDLAERDASIFFKMKLLSEYDLQVSLPFNGDAVALEEAQQILSSAYLEKYSYSEGEINLFLEIVPTQEFLITVEYENQSAHLASQKICEEKKLASANNKILLATVEGKNIGHANFKIGIKVGEIILYKDFTAEIFPKSKISVYAPTISERKKNAIKFLSENGDNNLPKVLTFLNQDLNHENLEKIISSELKRINERVDCADFRVPSLIWILNKYQNSKILNDKYLKIMKDTIINFRYWQDEIGNDVMWFFSENHALAFHTSEFLAGELYENEIFSNQGMTGAEHKIKGKKLLLEWFEVFFKYGYSEWNSAPYIPIDLISFFALYELSKDSQIKALAKKALDFTFEIFAKNSFKGTIASSQGRIYTRDLICRKTNETTALSWIAWGEGNLTQGVWASAPFAISTYEPPIELEKFAKWDSENLFINESTQGEEKVKLYFVKNKYYSMGSLKDYKVFKHGHQELIFQIFLNDTETQMFFSHPGEKKIFGENRPSYFAGNGSVSKVIQEKNEADIFVNIDESETVDFTHMFVPIQKFSETKIIDKNNIFLRKENSYVCIFAENGLEIVDSGPLKNLEIKSYGRKNFWKIAVSSIKESKSFENFIKIRSNI